MGSDVGNRGHRRDVADRAGTGDVGNHRDAGDTSVPRGAASPADSPNSSGGAPFGAVLAGGESSRYGSPKALATVGGVRIVDRVIRAVRQVTPDLILSANEPELFEGLGLPTYPDERPGLGPLGGIYTTLLRAREAGRPGILAVACDMPFPSVRLLMLLRTRAFETSLEPDVEGVRDSYSGSYSYSGADPGPGADPSAKADPSAGPDPSGKADPSAEADPDADPNTNSSTNTKSPRPDIVLPVSVGPRGVEPLFAAYRTTCIPAIDAALADGDRRMIGFHERVSVHTIPLSEVVSRCDPERAFLNVNTPQDRERAEAMAKRDEGGR